MAPIKRTASDLDSQEVIQVRSTSIAAKEGASSTAPTVTNLTASKRHRGTTRSPTKSVLDPTTTSSSSSQTAQPQQKPKGRRKPKAIFNSPPTEPYSIYVFGSNESSQLGIGRYHPTTPIKSPHFNPLLSEAGIVQVALGEAHGVALTQDQRVLTWGCADFGQLGRDLADEEGERDEPRAVEWMEKLADDAVIVQVAASRHASFALTATGEVWGWGTFRNNQGAFGILPDVRTTHPDEARRPLYYPARLDSLGNIVALASSPHAQHLLALNNVGQVYALGAGQANQLGRRLTERNKDNGLIANRVEFKAKGVVTGKVKIKAIATGNQSGWALDDAGKVWSWGNENFGELGQNDPDDQGEENHEEKGKAHADSNGDNPPAPAKTPPRKNDIDTAAPRLCLALSSTAYENEDDPIESIAAGRDFAVARSAAGKVYTFGRIDGLALGHDVSTLPVSDVRIVGRWNNDPTIKMDKQSYLEYPHCLARETAVKTIGTISGPDGMADSKNGNSKYYAHPCLAVGPQHIVTVNDHGIAYSWGANEGWRLGLGGSSDNNASRLPRAGDVISQTDQELPQQVYIGEVLKRGEKVVGAVAGGRFGVLLAVKDDNAKRDEREKVGKKEIPKGLQKGPESSARMMKRGFVQVVETAREGAGLHVAEKGGPFAGKPRLQGVAFQRDLT